MVSNLIILTSLFYIWITPLGLAYAIMLIVENYKKGIVDKDDFILLGVVLCMIIFPIYCMLFRILEHP